MIFSAPYTSEIAPNRMHRITAEMVGIQINTMPMAHKSIPQAI